MMAHDMFRGIRDGVLAGLMLAVPGCSPDRTGATDSASGSTVTTGVTTGWHHRGHDGGHHRGHQRRYGRHARRYGRDRADLERDGIGHDPP